MNSTSHTGSPGVGLFHNFRLRWPLPSKTGNNFTDGFINGINMGKGDISEVEFNATRLQWRSRIKTGLTAKFAALQASKLRAFSAQKECFDLLLKMSGATGCLACDPQWADVVNVRNETVTPSFVISRT